MEQKRNINGRRYAFYSAKWNKWQKMAILEIVCNDGRMLRLLVSDASKKWCNYYKSVISSRENTIIKKYVGSGVSRWQRMTASTTVSGMQAIVDKWQSAMEVNDG